MISSITLVCVLVTSIIKNVITNIVHFVIAITVGTHLMETQVKQNFINNFPRP